MSDVTITITVSSGGGNATGDVDVQALPDDAAPDPTIGPSLDESFGVELHEGEAGHDSEGAPPLDLAALGVSDPEAVGASLGDSAGPEDLEGGYAEESGDDDNAPPEDVG